MTDRHAIPKFRCPICGDITAAKVINSRMNHRKGYYWRRHKCPCGATFTTKQTVAALDCPPDSHQHLAR